MPQELDPNNGEVTDNHNLPKVPPLDDEYADQWGYVVNDGEFSDGSDAGSDSLVQALEERTPVVDTAANRSNYTPHTDAVFIASDTGRLYLGDGSAWDLVGSETNPISGTVHVEAVSASDVIGNAVYQSPSDIPAELEQAGNMVVTESDGLVVFTP